MTILFAGGGTLGPVTPLLATARAMRQLRSDLKFVWVGTPQGPEKALVEAEGIAFRTLPVVKWTHYPSWQWLGFSFKWWRVRRLADRMIKEIAPDVVVTAGGFTAAPLAYAAARYNIPCVAHQLDFVPGKTNRMITGLCACVTTSFEYSKPPFGKRIHVERIATPMQFAGRALPSRAETLRHFGLDTNKPVVLIVGGGTGSQALNEMVERSLDEWLSFAQIVHITGIGKGSLRVAAKQDYVAFDLLVGDEMFKAMSLADLVICRSGIGTLSEIAALSKAAITIPLPDSPQEANAREFEKQGAIIVMHQNNPTLSEDVLNTARRLFKNDAERHGLGQSAHEFFKTDDGTELAVRVLTFLETIRRQSISM